MSKLAKRRIEIDVVANDNASSVFQNIRSNASSMSSSLMSTLGGSVSAVANFDNILRSYNNSMYRFNRVVGSVVSAAGDSIYNFTKGAISNFSELEQQHAKTMGAMATEYDKTAEAQKRFLDDSEKLKQQALRLGTTGPTGVGSLNTVTDVSYAQTALIKAGLSADDLLKTDAIESILKFAGGNDLDIDTATRFAVNLGTVFNKPVNEWGAMLDMVTKAADISVIDVEDIMDSLTYTGGIASGLGRDLGEVLGVISVMGQAGLRGRVAGTGLQAFFTRILSAGELSDTAIGNAPSEYVGQMYNAFIEEAVNPDGSFKEMDEVASLLDTAMSELDDQEQAWFAKKLFGLYQMKAAYALTGAVDGDENVITDFIDQIENQSSGTNDGKYDIMLNSQYGKLERLSIAWEGIKTDFGDRLSPVVTAVGDELFNFLNNPNNYEINWDTLREAISESGGLISEKYGKELGQVVENIGNFGIDAALITEAIAPTAGGIFSGIIKLLNGDISGALEDFSDGIDATNTNIEGLPEDLQDTANAAKNAFIALTALAGVNLATQILQPIVTAITTLFAKPISWAVGKITSTNTTVSSPNTNIASANYVGVNTSNTSVQAGTATAVNIGQVPLMNVTATVVNVYGGNGLNNNPSGGNLPTGGSPLLPTSGSSPFLIGTGTGALVGAGTATIATTAPAAIAGSGVAGYIGAGTSAAAGTGTVLNTFYNPFTKSYMTYAELGGMAKGAGITALKSIPFWASLAYLSMAPSSDSQNSTAWQYGFGTDYSTYLGEDYQNIDSMAEFFHDTFGPAEGHWNNDLSNYDMQQFKKNEVDPATPDEYRQARDELFDSIEGFSEYTIGREYISGLMDRWYYDNSDGNKNFITQEQYVLLAAALVDAMGQYMQENNIDPSTGMAGDVPGVDTNIYADILNDMLNNTGTGAVGGVIGSTVSSALNGEFSRMNDILNRINSPVINVDVTTNVDKSGNATSKVDINTISRDISRRSSQYGQVSMMN